MEGRAARKRFNGQVRHLAEVARTDPQAFMEKWNRRMASWLKEIDLAVKEWRTQEEDEDCDAANICIFKIVDHAMMILAACGPKVWDRYAAATYSELTHACTAQIASFLYPRLYRLSNFDAFDTLKSHGGKNYDA